jgi:ubiquinone/menaquinone biosynthesis C-methylase UbiE
VDFDATAVVAQYGPVAMQYADVHGDNLETHDFDRAVLTRALADTSPDRLVLDAGCGPAQCAAFVEARDGSAIALDLTPGMLKVARRRVRAPLVCGDLRALPFADCSFDAVMAWFSLLHLPRASMPDALIGIRRVMRVGAPLVVALQGGTGDVTDGTAASWCAYTATEIAGLLDAAGFNSVVTGSRPPRPHEYQATKVIASAIRP